MRRKLKSIAVTSILVGAGVVALTPGAARADFYETNSFFCSGPYTTGYGIATMTAGKHEHWRGNSSTPDVKIWVFTNAGTTQRKTSYHGAGSQSFIVMGNGSISGVSRGCELIG